MNLFRYLRVSVFLVFVFSFIVVVGQSSVSSSLVSLQSVSKFDNKSLAIVPDGGFLAPLRAASKTDFQTHIATDRGCLEKGQNPVYVVGDSILIQFRIDGIDQALAIIEDILPDGRTQVILHLTIPGSQTFQLRGRIVEPIGTEKLKLTAHVGERAAADECSFTVAASHRPSIQTEPSKVDFGEVLIGEVDHNSFRNPNTASIRIRNVGGSELSIRSIRFQQGDVFDFCDITYNNFTLLPGGSQGIYVCFSPRDSGTFQDELLIESSDPLAPIIKVLLTATAKGCIVTIEGGGQRPNKRIEASVSPGTPAFAVNTNPPFIDPTTPIEWVNAGEQIILKTKLTPVDVVPFFYLWTVDKPHVKDYDETVASGFRTFPLTLADLIGPEISFYWQDVGDKNVSVTVVAIRDIFGFPVPVFCSNSVKFTVKRNPPNGDDNERDRQAEDFYTFNHKGRVLVDHLQWHSDHRFMLCIMVGEEFFVFHQKFLDRFNSWRTAFGYPEIQEWKPFEAIPTGPPVDHMPRDQGYNPTANTIPSWFTRDGRSGENSECSNGTVAGSPLNGLPPRMKLRDFPDANALGIEFEERWHNLVHANVGGPGGDMTRPHTAPKDPIFWRWHRFVDSVYRDWLTVTASGSPRVRLIDPPGGAARKPITSISVTFSERVFNVTSGNLTVNGTAATAVTGSGAGPYVFTFPATATMLPTINVTLNPGAIRDSDNNPFAGASWTYRGGAPRIRSIDPPPVPVGAPSTIAITFDENVSNVTAPLLVLRVTLANGQVLPPVSATAIAGGGAGPYTFTLPALNPNWSVINVELRGNVITDGDGNVFGGAQWRYDRAR